MCCDCRPVLTTCSEWRPGSSSRTLLLTPCGLRSFIFNSVAKRFDTHAKKINRKTQVLHVHPRGCAELSPCGNRVRQPFSTFCRRRHRTVSERAEPCFQLNQNRVALAIRNRVFLWWEGVYCSICLMMPVLGSFLPISGSSSYFSCLVFYVSSLRPWTSLYIIRYNGLLVLNVLKLENLILNLTFYVNQDKF